MITGLDELERFAQRLDALGNIPREAAKRAAPALLKVAQAEYAAGEAPDGARWDALKQSGGVPLRALTSTIDAKADGAAVVITTPEPTKYHQGGYFIHPDESIGERLREAQAAVKTAKAGADAERHKHARKRVNAIKKQIRTEGTRVVARRTLPGRRSMPVPWGRALQEAWDQTVAAAMGGTS